MSLLKDIMTKHKDFAVIKVGKTAFFDDPDQLTEIVVSTADDEDDNRHNRNRNSRHNKDTSADRDTILSDDERTSSKLIRQALSSWRTAVPLFSVEHGKATIHLACQPKYPDRMRATFECLIPSSKDVKRDRGGAFSDAMTLL